IETNTKDSLDEQILELKRVIKTTEQQIKSYNLDEVVKDIESFIQKTMNDIGDKFDFESDYKPINLNFSLKTFDIWHEPRDEKNKKIFLRSMGSGANWLYTHLALFLSFQALFCKLKDTCSIPPILFIDQPTQVYFPNVTSDNDETFNASNMVGSNDVSDKIDHDINSVETFFNEIISFCENMSNEFGIEPQIVIIDHADNLELSGERKFEDYVQARWRSRGFIECD
uniref:DUF3732 domain-containing protein n=1 Tax=Vibrio sp. V23_P3S9T160 TaxID=1938675 RepID=UPI0013737F5D